MLLVLISAKILSIVGKSIPILWRSTFCLSQQNYKNKGKALKANQFSMIICFHETTFSKAFEELGKEKKPFHIKLN